MDSFQSFIEELQALEEPTKRKVLIVATAIIMIVVIYFWLAYFNSIVGTASQPAVADQGQSGPGLLGNVGNGMATMYQSTRGSIEWLGGLFGSSKQYIVQGTK